MNNTAKVLEFPYSRIRQEPEAHTAKILSLPKQQPLVGDLWVAAARAWMEVFEITGKWPK